MFHCFTLLVGSLWACQQPGLNQPGQGWQHRCALSARRGAFGMSEEKASDDKSYLKIHSSGKSSKHCPCAGYLDRTEQGCGPSREGPHTWGIGCTPILIVSSVGELLCTAHGLRLRLVAASVPHGCWVWPLRASGVWFCAVNRNQLLLWKRTLFSGFVPPDVVKHSYLKAIYEFYVSFYEFL